MIFYFTGTGNSYAAALALQRRVGGDIYDIKDCVKNGNYSFENAPDEPVGIVFPVYYGGLPSILHVFLSRLKLKNKPAYLYGILTYGGTYAASGKMLEDRLAANGLPLNAVFYLKMPANYAILYEPTREDKEGDIFDAADRKLAEIAEKIDARESIPLSPNPALRLMTTVMYPLYVHGRKTAPFYTNDSCISCGACATRCPEGAIEMINGTPTWVKDRCVFCMSCVRCGAIEYGSKITGRYRYKHPLFRKKKPCH